MDALESFFHMGGKGEVIIALFIAGVALKFALELIDYFINRFGLQTKYTRHEDEQSEAIKILKIEVEQIKHDQIEVIGTMNELKDTMIKMESKSDKDRRARLKDRINESYNYYNTKGKWNVREQEAFLDLISAYESAGGENSFVHTLCLPASANWELVD